jgi:hypothetical protein
LLAAIAGRTALIATGLYPLDSAENVTGIVGGTSIAAIFAWYVWVKRISFKTSPSDE